jgi:hypothetical protein
MKDDIKDIGEEIEWSQLAEDMDWKTLADPKSYYPTRLEYFAGKALQGLVTGRSERDLKHVGKRSLLLGIELAEAIDEHTAQER